MPEGKLFSGVNREDLNNSVPAFWERQDMVNAEIKRQTVKILAGDLYLKMFGLFKILGDLNR